MDAAVAELILDRLTPLAIEVALTVTDEITAQAEHADRIRAAHVQRAQHTADLARRRYLAVDPTNRLVADHLEADYNTALRELASATPPTSTKPPRPVPSVPSTTPTATAYAHWPLISRPCGTTQPLPCANASG